MINCDEILANFDIDNTSNELLQCLLESNIQDFNLIEKNSIQNIKNMINCNELDRLFDIVKIELQNPQIKSISFNNFKAFGEKLQKFSFKPITLIYAPNSLGKSSFQHSIVHLHYFIKKHLISKIVSLKKTLLFGDEIDLGGFENYIHKHQLDREIEYVIDIDNCNKAYLKGTIHDDYYNNEKYYTNRDINVEYFFINLIEKFDDTDIQKALSFLLEYFEIEYENLKNDYNIDEIENKLFYISSRQDYKKTNEELIEYEILMKLKLAMLFAINQYKEINQNSLMFLKEYIQNNFIQNQVLFTDKMQLQIKYIISYDYHEAIYKIDDKEFEFNSDMIETSSDNDSQNETTEEVIEEEIVEKNDIKMIKEFDNIILSKSIQYIGPLRYYPDRNFILDTQCPENEKTSYNSSNLWSLIKKRKNIRKELNKWLSNESKLKSNYELVVKEDGETIVFKDKRTNTEVSHKDLGLGITQILPILISTHFARGKTISIEQPELHLHPAVQAEIADEFIKSYKEWGNNFIIETHSEYLLLRLMRRMRYKANNKDDRDKKLDITPDDICLLYVDQDDNEVYLKELRLNQEGALLNKWPGGFFEEGFKERFE